MRYNFLASLNPPAGNFIFSAFNYKILSFQLDNLNACVKFKDGLKMFNRFDKSTYIFRKIARKQGEGFLLPEAKENVRKDKVKSFYK